MHPLTTQGRMQESGKKTAQASCPEPYRSSVFYFYGIYPWRGIFLKKADFLVQVFRFVKISFCFHLNGTLGDELVWKRVGRLMKYGDPRLEHVFVPAENKDIHILQMYLSLSFPFRRPKYWHTQSYYPIVSVQGVPCPRRLGFVDLDLGSSPGCWAATVATYCPSRMVEHSKSKSTQPSCQTTSPTLSKVTLLTGFC